jgi:hypothetical protein
MRVTSRQARRRKELELLRKREQSGVSGPCSSTPLGVRMRTIPYPRPELIEAVEAETDGERVSIAAERELARELALTSANIPPWTPDALRFTDDDRGTPGAPAVPATTDESALRAPGEGAVSAASAPASEKNGTVSAADDRAVCASAVRVDCAAPSTAVPSTPSTPGTPLQSAWLRQERGSLKAQFSTATTAAERLHTPLANASVVRKWRRRNRWNSALVYDLTRYEWAVCAEPRPYTPEGAPGRTLNIVHLRVTSVKPAPPRASP